MARYSFDGTNLNDPNNYDLLNDDGTPVLDGQGLPVHPSAVPGPGNVIENLSGGMSGTSSVDSFLSWEFGPLSFLSMGSIDAGTVGHTGAGGGATSASIVAGTIINGTSARANGTVRATTISGGASASDGGTVTVTSQLTGGASASNGGDILGASATFDSASASGAGSTISANIITQSVSATNGGSVTAHELHASSGSVGVTAASGGSVTVDDIVALGTVAISGGSSLLINNSSSIGQRRGDQLAVTLSGAGSTFNPGAALIVGEQGLGTFTLNGGADVTYASLAAATNFFTSGPPRGGSIRVDNDSALHIGAGAVIGQAGRATLDVRGGSTLDVGADLRLGVEQTASGGFLVRGADSVTTIALGLVLGDSGQAGGSNAVGGDWPIQTGAAEGGHIEVGGDLTLGVQATGSGSMQVHGAGSLLHVGRTTTIGEAGSGSVLVAYGGDAQFDGSVVIGNQANASGALTVRAQAFGAQNANQFLAASATIDGDLIVGVAGTASASVSADSSIAITGDLTVGGPNGRYASSGTTTVTQDVVLAPTAGSTAGLSVNGGTFSWGGTFDVGAFGTGSLTVSGGRAAASAGPGTMDVGDRGTGAVNVVGTGELVVGTMSVGAEVGGGQGGTGKVVVNGSGATLEAQHMTLGGASANINQYLDWRYTGTGNGTLSVLGGGYVSIAQTLSLHNAPFLFGDYDVTVSSDSSLEIGGNSGRNPGNFVIDPAGMLIGHGTVSFGDDLGGGAFNLSTIWNYGTIVAQDGKLFLHADVGGTGTARIMDNAELELFGRFAGTVDFAGNYETVLTLHDPANFFGTLSGLDVGDTIRVAYADLPTGSGGPATERFISHTEIVGSQLVVTLANNEHLTWNVAGIAPNTVFTTRILSGDVYGLTVETSSNKTTTHVDGTPTDGQNVFIDSLVEGWAKWTNSTIYYWFGQAGDIRTAVNRHGETERLQLEDADNQNFQIGLWTEEEKQLFRDALKVYEAVTPLRFSESAAVDQANLVFWLNSNLDAGVGGESELPSMMPDGHAWLHFNFTNPGWQWRDFGSDSRQSAIHEIGHALGLAHPFDGGNQPDRNIFPGATPDLFDANGDPLHYSTGTDAQNERVFTVMSYNRGWNDPGAQHDPSLWLSYGDQGGLGAFDIRALQILYGVNDQYHRDDNLGIQGYTLPHQNAAGTGYQAIWDAGGIDEIRAGDTDLNATIDLRNAPLTGANAGGYVSHLEGIMGGFTIAYDAPFDNAFVHIENATGGRGNDTLIGNDGSNRLNGGRGADRLTGGLANDYFVFDADALADARGATFDLILDYSADQFDVIDLSAIMPPDLTPGQSWTRLVPASGGNRHLEINIDAAEGGANWKTIASFGGSVHGVWALSDPSQPETFIPLDTSNAAPIITSNGGGDTASVVVAENTTAVTTIVAIDPDVGTTLSYSIVGGADEDKFQINAANGALSFIAAPDFELPTDTDGNNSYIVQVQASDGGLADVQTLTINVSDVADTNRSPIITSNGGGDTASVVVAENTTLVTTLAASDPDAGQTLTFSVSGGEDSGLFEIRNGNELHFITAPAFENPLPAGATAGYQVEIQVSDGHGGVDTQAITVTAPQGFTEGSDTVTLTQPGGTWHALGDNDYVTGTGGNDIIYGDAGNDTLDGGAGVDQLLGGAGNDLIYWDANDDLANVLGGADTDTLCVLNAAAPTGFSLAAHEFEQAQVRATDVSNNQPWSEYTEYYNSGWQFFQRDVSNDDSSTSRTLIDIAGAQIWSSVTTYYNPSGQTALQSITNDDGTFRATYWDPGDLKPWISADTFYDTQFRTTLQSVANDDGTFRATYWDPVDLKPWTSADTFYDTQFRTTLQSVANDDGTFRATYWDPGDLKPWISADTFYDAQGRTTLQSVADDDGTSHVQYWDVNDSASWDTVIHYYDDLGSRTVTTGFDDFGLPFSH